MKLTLHKPPEGFEAEAEYRFPVRAEKIIDSRGDVITCAYEGYSKRIVLTPKKHKYWRLDPVATFEETTPVSNYETLRYGYYRHGEIGLFHKGANVQWLRVTECEE